MFQLDSATSLIQAAKNLMNAVVLTVKSSYVASTKYPRPAGQVVVSSKSRFLRLNYIQVTYSKLPLSQFFSYLDSVFNLLRIMAILPYNNTDFGNGSFVFGCRFYLGLLIGRVGLFLLLSQYPYSPTTRLLFTNNKDSTVRLSIFRLSNIITLLFTDLIVSLITVFTVCNKLCSDKEIQVPQ